MRWNNNFVNFKHQKTEVDGIQPNTLCTISVPEYPNIEFTGTAKCSKDDAFNKRIGRYYAFKYAVRQINDKEIRTRLWDEFNNRFLKEQGFEFSINVEDLKEELTFNEDSTRMKILFTYPPSKNGGFLFFE